MDAEYWMCQHLRPGIYMREIRQHHLGDSPEEFVRNRFTGYSIIKELYFLYRATLSQGSLC